MPLFSTSDWMSASACAYAAPLPRMISGFFAWLQQVERALDRVGCRNLLRRRIDDLDQRGAAGGRVDALRKEFGRQVEVHAARAARHGRANRARDADTDVFGVQHAESRLGHRLGDRELVHLFVVALLQVDDLALARAADQDHREAVDGGVRERVEAVQEAGRRHRQADAWLAGEEAGDRRRIAGVLLVAERQHAKAIGLRAAREVGDRNARQAVDRVDVVELERFDDELEAVDRCHGGFRAAGRRRGGTGFGADGHLDVSGLFYSTPIEWGKIIIVSAPWRLD